MKLSEKLLYIEIDSFCIVIALIVFFKILRNEKIKERKILNIIWLVMIMFFLSDIIWKAFEGTDKLSIMNFCNFLYFSTSGIFAYLWYFYCEIALDTKFHKSKVFKILMFIPALLLLIFLLIPGMVFTTNDGGQYSRGPLYVIHPVVSIGYLASASIRSLLFGKNKNYFLKNKSQNLAKFAFYPALCGGLQAVFYGTPLVSIGITISIISIFIEMQKQKITKDPLTSLNNRIDLLKYLEWQINRYKNRNLEKELYVLYLDIDDFKLINDNFGHSEGDRALLKISDALKKLEKKLDSYIARIGGDEFVLVCELENNNSLEEVIKNIKEEIANIKDDKYTLSVSIGTSKLTNEMSSTKILAQADEKLYKEKSGK